MPGAFAVTAGATLLVFALVEGPEFGWRAPVIIGSFILAAIFLIAFTLIEVRSSDPLMPTRLIRNRSLIAGMSITFLYMGTFGALPYFLTVLFQNVQGLSAFQTGLAFLVPSLAIVAGTQTGEKLATRTSTKVTLITGMALGAASTARAKVSRRRLQLKLLE